MLLKVLVCSKNTEHVLGCPKHMAHVSLHPLCGKIVETAVIDIKDSIIRSITAVIDFKDVYDVLNLHMHLGRDSS